MREGEGARVSTMVRNMLCCSFRPMKVWPCLFKGVEKAILPREVYIIEYPSICQQRHTLYKGRFKKKVVSKTASLSEIARTRKRMSNFINFEHEPSKATNISRKGNATNYALHFYKNLSYKNTEGQKWQNLRTLFNYPRIIKERLT